MTIKQENMETSPLSIEETLNKLMGQFGKWQLIIFVMVSLIKVSSAWVQMSILFLTPFSTFQCVELANNSTFASPEIAPQEVEMSRCYEDCVKYEYDTRPFENTIVSEWRLICDRRWMASFTQTLLQLGVLVGSVAFGFFSDRFGRKNTFLSSVTMVVIIGFAVPFSPNYWTFTTLRFFLGMSCAGTMVISFVIIMEVTGPKYRSIVGCIYFIPYVLGHLSIPLFAYLFKSWYSYCLALAVPQLVYLMYFVFLPESPRWLVSVGRIEEATKIIKSAAKMNKLPTASIEATMTKLATHLTLRSNSSHHNYLHLFHRTLLFKTLGVCLIWFSVGIMFFGFNQYISQTSRSPFVSTALAGVIQIPSVFSAMWAIKHFGRRLVIAVNFLLSGACVISLGVIPPIFWLTTTISTVGVMFASHVATVVYIYSSELYPTVIRNMGIGAASTSMRVGSMLAPFVSNLSIAWLPPLVIGLIQLCAGLVCLMMPETRNTVLPDKMEDLKRNNDIEVKCKS